MNTFKRIVTFAAEAKGIKRLLVLVTGALVFAMPFVTKSLALSLPLSIASGMCGWLGLSVLFLTVFDFKKTLKRVLYSLFCFFFAFYFFVYSWFINLYPLDFAGLGNLESVGVIIVAMTLIPLIHSTLMTVSVFAGYIAAKRFDNGLIKAILISFGYVLGEYSQSLGTFAFPWARLFVGQTYAVELLQSASLFGSYFITFIMVLVNALVAMSVMNVEKKDNKSRVFALAALGIFAVNFVFGIVRVNVTDYSECDTLDAVVLQGNIPSGEKWSGEVDEKSIYTDLSKTAKEQCENKKLGADIAVIPETAFPVSLIYDDGHTSPYENASMNISEILDAEVFVGAFSKEGKNSYNSIFVYNKDGFVSGPYNKYNIVPFGEFLPYRSIIEKIAPSFAEINMLSSDLSRGENFIPLKTEAGDAACLVCFDSIFPETARIQVRNGADFIVISTNDSWYKTSSAIYQHADHAIMRAIENNVPVIRSANTGISRIISPLGKVQACTGVNERTLLAERVTLPQKTTLYTVTGDIIVPLSALLLVCAYIVGRVKMKKASHTE